MSVYVSVCTLYLSICPGVQCTHAKFGFWFNFAHSAVWFYGKFCQNLKNCQSKSNWKHKRTNEHECARERAFTHMADLNRIRVDETAKLWNRQDTRASERANEKENQRETRRERHVWEPAAKKDWENERNAPNQNLIPFTNLPCTCKTIK